MRWKHLFFFLIIMASDIGSVDQTNFKSCEQSSFCKRCRTMEPDNSTFEFLTKSATITSSVLNSKLIDTKYNVEYSFQFFAIEGGVFRLKVNEINSLKPRFEVSYVLTNEPALKPLEMVESSNEKVVVKSGDSTAHIYAKPFKIDLYYKELLLISANSRGLMRFEFHRKKPIRVQEASEEESENAQKVEEASVEDSKFSIESGAWEENFKSSHDSKPNGPEAVAMDFSFPEAVVAYGLPEHADSLALKSTKNGDPYRLYNLDVFEYELNSKMALYAAIPLLFAHGPKATVGVFWLNSAETWIDIMSKGDQNVLSSIVNLVSGSNSKNQVDAHFMSESGIIDTFFLMGPTHDDVQKQYASLTGTAPLPQMFALGYHQCRWNYVDEDDVRNVAEKFDELNIPMDVMWLDIEHTDNKKYFTWDPIKFAHPVEMTKNLTEKGRKLVAIIDPHIKRDAGYFLHNDAEANNYYVKTPDGKDYEGWCWSGSSSYLDFLNPEARNYYADRFLLENYKGSTLNTYVWNDMNEPSVFNGPEITMPKDMVHHGGWEHRHIHNIYGFLHTMSTYDGLLRRSQGKLRPFILTRSAFAGSQRYVAIWTGDNAAEWSHLKASIPMCLSLSLGGLPLCGADVGGFFKNPDSELFYRWFQAGAFQPFFRSHSHIETKRREPWTMGQPTTDLIRAAISKRYTYLPYWYTLMYEHETTAALVMRPLWTEFPKEEATFTIEDEYLLGKSLLVHPVTDKGVTSVNVYFPGTNEIWYDADTYQKFTTNGNVKISVDMEKIPVFIRGGSIIPKKERVRRATPMMRDDPFTLIVALDKTESATGSIYIDDEQSFEYRQGKYIYLKLDYRSNKLVSSFAPVVKADSQTCESNSLYEHTKPLLNFGNPCSVVDNGPTTFSAPDGGLFCYGPFNLNYLKMNGNEHSVYETKAWLERVVVVGLSKAPSSAEILVSGKSTPLQMNYSEERQVLVIRKPGVNMGQQWEIKMS